MKLKYYLIAWIIIIVTSCQQDNLLSEQTKPNKVEITREEYMSIAFDTPQDISKSQVIQLVKDFESIQKESRACNYTYTIKRTYSLNDELSLSRSYKNSDITMYDRHS